MSACSACGEAMAPFLATRDYNLGVSQDAFRYGRCPRCALISIENAPADLGRYYAARYHVLPASLEEALHGAEHERYKIDLVLRYASGGRLLEVGPSWGAFCLLAKRAGFGVEAIEMDPACCEFLANRIGIRVIRGADEAAALADAQTPDVVTLWHVIEHLRDPWTLLARAAERLAPGGLLVLATPNPGAFQFGLLGRYWAHVDAPRHLHLIPAELLRQRMTALGLEQLLCTTTDPGSIGWNAFGWRFSLANFAQAPGIRRALRFAGRLAAAAFAPLENREGRGSAYTAVFRKPPARR